MHRVRGLGLGWVGLAMAALACVVTSSSPDALYSQGSLPNLRPHEPRDWSDRIVVSNVKDTHRDSSLLRDTDDLFIDFAVINAGSASVTEPFHIELFVDGRPLKIPSERSPSDPLETNYYVYVSDFWIGRLSAGAHTLKMVVDTEDTVSESNERDNEYSRSITVRQGTVSSCFPLTTGVVPQGGGTITASRTSTCSVTTNRLSSLAGRDGAPVLPSAGPVMAVKPTAEVQRERTVAALRARAQAKGRVRVIVGLRTDDPSGASTRSSFKDAAARATMVGAVDRVQQALLVRMSGYSVSSVKRFKYIP